MGIINNQSTRGGDTNTPAYENRIAVNAKLVSRNDGQNSDGFETRAKTAEAGSH